MATTVVLAEDEAIVRLDLREILEEEGFEVVGETGRGDEALKLIKELKPDLALLDIKMPGLDGLSVAREVATQKETAVLILTAFSQRSNIEEAMSAGVAGYLIKPFQRSELLPAIDVALARSKNDSLTDGDRLTVDKAKAKLMDDHGLSESDAINFLQDGNNVDRANAVNSGALKPQVL